MISHWGRFRDYINSKEVGFIFIRQKLQNSLQEMNYATMDGYRSLIQQAKFIERVGRGQYKLISHMPENLTMGSLFSLLKGDNLSYVESLQDQKERVIVKKQFLKDRIEIINRLLRDIEPLIKEVETIETAAFGLKKIRRNCKWELNKYPNPTKVWLQRRNKPTEITI